MKKSKSSFGGRGRRRFNKKVSKRGQIYGSAAYQLYKDVAFLKSVINTEYKTCDTSASPAFTTSWQFNNLSLLAEGDDMTNRNGRSVLAKSFFIRLGISINVAATVPSRCRVVIFIDKFNAGADPTATQVFTGNTSVSMMNITSQQGRFKILMDKFITVDPATGGPSAVSYNRYIKLQHHIKYINTAAAVTSCGPGQIYIAWLADDATNAPTMAYYARIRYLDN